MPVDEGDNIQIPGNVNTTTVSTLSIPLKGLMALYSAMGGSYCSDDSCRLTSALGLGKQGSQAHKDIIKKFLPNDPIAQKLLSQNCYLRPDGASSFNGYKYLVLTTLGDTIKVDYDLYVFSHGDESHLVKQDTYLLQINVFRRLQ
jgi:hypothetical protein